MISTAYLMGLMGVEPYISRIIVQLHKNQYDRVLVFNNVGLNIKAVISIASGAYIEYHEELS